MSKNLLSESLTRAIKKKEQVTRPRGATPSSESEEERYQSSAISLKPTQWKRLRNVARNRKDRNGGRESVSAILSELVDKYLPELEEEFK